MTAFPFFKIKSGIFIRDTANSTCSHATDPYSSSASLSSSTPRTIHAVSTRQDRNQQHSISATLPTATIIRDSDVVSSSHLLSPVQHNRPLSSQHDLIIKPFSPVTDTRGSSPPASHSLDNQVPSYTPLNTRYSTPASRDPPSLLGLQNVGLLEKPASSSSHTSSTTQSSSNHSNLTHMTAFTSTSSIAPAIKVTLTIFSLRFFFCHVNGDALQATVIIRMLVEPVSTVYFQRRTFLLGTCPSLEQIRSITPSLRNFAFCWF